MAIVSLNLRRLPFPTQLALAGGGLGVSLELIRSHVESHYGKGGDTGLCTALAIFSCDSAAKSDFSAIAGLPIAVLGAAFYASLLVLLPLGRFAANRGFGRVPDVMLGASIGSVAYSMFLLGVSLLALGKLCPLCMGLYLINLGLFLTAWLSHPEGRRGALATLPSLWRRFETWLAVVLVAGAVFGFQNLYARQARATRQASRALLPNAGPPITLDLAEATAHGPPDAALTVVEFSDFQCPYCRKLAEALKVAAERHGSVRIIFRHYPMDSSCNRAVEGKFHEFACGAAKAALCADAQGRLWAMHDVMFENQRSLSPGDLIQHARTAGLDTATFATCLEAPETTARLERDLARAQSLDLKGTPSWFVNGLAYVGARSTEELLAIFERTAPGTTRGPGASDPKAVDHHP